MRVLFVNIILIPLTFDCKSFYNRNRCKSAFIERTNTMAINGFMLAALRALSYADIDIKKIIK